MMNGPGIVFFGMNIFRLAAHRLSASHSGAGIAGNKMGTPLLLRHAARSGPVGSLTPARTCNVCAASTQDVHV
jgi:hypothetical protein